MKNLNEYETPETDAGIVNIECEDSCCGIYVKTDDGRVVTDDLVSVNLARDLERRLAMCRNALREIYRKPACESFEIAQKALKATEPNL